MAKIDIQNRESIEDGILELLFIAEINLSSCIKINEFINNNKGQNGIKQIKFFNSPITRFLILTANNCFFESVSVLKSLLIPSNGELSFDVLIDNNFINNEFLIDKLTTIKKEFKDKKFEIIRHKIADHKDIKHIGSPHRLVLITIKDEKINDLNEVIKNLKEIIYKDKLFNAPIGNNYLGISLIGLDKILNLISSPKNR